MCLNYRVMQLCTFAQCCSFHTYGGYCCDCCVLNKRNITSVPQSSNDYTHVYIVYNRHSLRTVSKKMYGMFLFANGIEMRQL